MLFHLLYNSVSHPAKQQERPLGMRIYCGNCFCCCCTEPDPRAFRPVEPNCVPRILMEPDVLWIPAGAVLAKLLWIQPPRPSKPPSMTNTFLKPRRERQRATCFEVEPLRSSSSTVVPLVTRLRAAITMAVDSTSTLAALLIWPRSLLSMIVATGTRDSLEAPRGSRGDPLAAISSADRRSTIITLLWVTKSKALAALMSPA
mmetsp:Transcript_28182/g.61762  ORF Transcript_28182/g.61762 Transcript_28182/m.61762 type:complete len:202 (-) Transcript_28182:737-1342(-)